MLSRIYDQEPFDLINVIGSPPRDFWTETENYQRMVFQAPTQTRIRILKFRVTSRLVTLVFSFEDASLDMLDQLLKYNTNTRILFISANTSSVSIVRDRIRDIKYSRALFIDVTSSSYETFGFFPSFEPTSNTFRETKVRIFESKVKNLHGYEIRVGHVENAPRGMKYYDSEGNLHLMGYVATILKVFCERINGSFTPVLIEDSQEDVDKKMLSNGEIDFITTYYNFASRNLSKFYENLQNVSETLELVEMTIMTPAPKEIQEKYYTIKPFDWRVWSIMFALWIYSSGSIAFVARKTSQTGDFSYFLGIVQRAFLNQPFQFPKNNPFQAMKIFYILIILFGFIMNLLYSALLGSFLATQLKEDSINTIEDFIEKKKYVLLASSDYRIIESNFDMDYFGPVFEVVDRAYFRYQKSTLNPSYSYVEKTDHWKYFAYPLMKFHNDFHFQLTQVKLNVFNFYLNINADSLYKEELNRFVYLIRDVGLYQFWCGNAFLDNLRYKLYPYFYSNQRGVTVDPLELDYFEWIFAAFLGGLTVSGIVFVMEVLLGRWKHWTCNRKPRRVFNINFYY